jgi:type IV pilus assembly protein PilE
VSHPSLLPIGLKFYLTRFLPLPEGRGKKSYRFVRMKGFSLLEVMVTSSIIAVLLTAGLMTYSGPILKTQQTAAKLDLLNLAKAMEDYFDQHHTYEGISIETLAYQPLSKEYVLRISVLNATSYKLAATPKKQHPDDQCGIFYLDQEGNKSMSGSGQQEDCW